MPQRKHKPEEIVAKLRQVDVLLSQGRPVADAIRAISVSGSPYSPGAISAPIQQTVWRTRSSQASKLAMRPGARAAPELSRPRISTSAAQASSVR
jgi:hypothetical protein